MIIDQKLFSDALGKIVSVCERPAGSSSTLQHFFYIKLFATGSELKLSASNMMRKIEVLLKEVSPHEPFCLGVMGVTLNSLVSALPEGPISLEPSGPELIVSSGRIKYNLPILQRDLFPTNQDQIETWSPFNIKDFLSSISKISFCTSTVDGRPTYTKAICMIEDFVICTDGYRMSFLPNAFFKNQEPILFPVESIKSFMTLFKDSEGGFVHLTPDRIHFSHEGYYASSALMNSKSPNFSAALPRDSFTPCTISKVELQSALKRIASVCKTSPAVFTFGNDALSITIDAESSRGQEVLSCSYGGAPTRMLLNHVFVRQAVKSLEGDSILFEIRGKEMSLLITDEKGVLRNVIMPQRSERS